MVGAIPRGDEARKREAALAALRYLVAEGVEGKTLQHNKCDALADRAERLLRQLPSNIRPTVLDALLTRIIERERQAVQANAHLRAAGEFIGLRDENVPDPSPKAYEKVKKSAYRTRILRGGLLLTYRGNPITTFANAKNHVPPACEALLIAIDLFVASDRDVNDLAGDIKQSLTARDGAKVGAATELLTPGDHEIESSSSELQSVERSFEPPAASRRVLFAVPIAVIIIVIIAVVISYAHLLGNSVTGASGGLRNGWLAATCGDIGNNQPNHLDPMWGDLFREAYNRAGREPELGCPRTDDPSGYVHPWAKGISQDLQGGKAGKARIMTLNNPKRVLVTAGSYYEDYTTPYGDNAAQTMGYPVSDPISCGPGTTIVLLDGAESAQGSGNTPQTPGAMVTNPETGRLAWVPRAIWERYERLGGPLGRLGRPTTNFGQAPSGAVQHFEHGYIRIASGAAKTDVEDRGQQEPSLLGNLDSCLNLK